MRRFECADAPAKGAPAHWCSRSGTARARTHEVQMGCTDFPSKFSRPHVRTGKDPCREREAPARVSWIRFGNSLRATREVSTTPRSVSCVLRQLTHNMYTVRAPRQTLDPGSELPLTMASAPADTGVCGAVSVDSPHARSLRRKFARTDVSSASNANLRPTSRLRRRQIDRAASICGFRVELTCSD